MLVVNVREVQAEGNPYSLKTLFSENDIPGGKVRFGVVTIPPKARVPLSGQGAHDQDEYSVIVKGSILTGAGDSEMRLSAGDATLIPAGEEHWAYNDGDEDCEIVWALVTR